MHLKRDLQSKAGILKYRKLILLAFATLILKLLSTQSAWVEKYYTYGIYPIISKTLRTVFGWIPFSVGDLLYFFAFLFLLVKTIKVIRLLLRKQFRNYISRDTFQKYASIVLWIYLAFNILWGFNYDRQGIAPQLTLDVQPYNTAQLYAITTLLQQRLCAYGEQTDSLERASINKNKYLFSESIKAFGRIDEEMIFLNYQNPSIKPSLYTHVGHYFGFTGYYNPFSAEAQLKTTLPPFLKPFVTCHEIAHQMGYAKENEANFVGFLVSKNAENNEFRYSAYFEMYLYAIRELTLVDPQSAYLLLKTAHPQYLLDYTEYRNYLIRNKNKVQPFTSAFYDNYLKLNKQSKGLYTYNEVVAWLIAYQKKYGAKAI